ncbi:tetratricopeptide repeat protein [Actinokineospora sp. UTMC 2448]|uniref:ATP-binding protein n=1 Tax=Actinokineospora sp. UTMC 2448 TaxID=2268449 RepID=UPI002164DF94|nr:tetratricopeptide repeat protein [Actinokineospora sp. UTMC 2448]UVS78718.1 Regulatory protein AfsR [Actinokineospora sp. UTMC 2448]
MNSVRVAGVVSGVLAQGERVSVTIGDVGGGTAESAGRPVAAQVRVLGPQAAEAAELFSGRSAEVGRLLGWLDPAGASGSVVVSAVAGMGGVGKTALARHCAVSAARAGWFPGGVFLADMRGYDAAPVAAAAVFSPLLRHLGVPADQIPADPGEARVVYDQTLDGLTARGMRVLLVVDNACDGDQVAPLVPARGGHVVVVTTRDTLDLVGARHLAVDVLAEGPATALLTDALSVLDPDDRRLTADASGTRALAAACGGLPLALRVAAGLLADEPELTAGDLAAQLPEAPGAEGFTRGEMAVTAALDRSWQRLARLRPAQARMLRLLCLAPGPDVSTDAAAALADVPVGAVRALLRGLRQAHLVVAAGRDRWSLHDLVRAHTATREVLGVDRAEQRAALHRLLDHYTNTTDRAAQHLRALPGQPVPDRFTGRQEALRWLDEERPALVAAVALATAEGNHAHAAWLAIALSRYLQWRRYLADWLTTAEHARASAAHLPPHHQAATAALHGNALHQLGRYGEAVSAHRQALRRYRDVGDRYGEATVLANLGLSLSAEGRLDDAIDAHHQALALYRAMGNWHGEAMVWTNLGTTLQRIGRAEEAILAHRRSGDLHRERGDSLGEAIVWTNLGAALQVSRRYDDAVAAHGRAAERFGEVDDQHGEAMALTNLGLALAGAGRVDEALAAYRRALDLHRSLDDRHGHAMALTNLGIALHRADRPDGAVAAHHAARRRFRELGDRQGEAMAWNNLGATLRADRRFDEAAVAYQHALALHRDLANPEGQAKALNNLGTALRRDGRFDPAITAFGQAAELYRGTGDTNRECKALTNLGAALHRTQRYSQARDCWTRAYDGYRAIGDTTSANRIAGLLKALPADT